jgi:hypothetical protein
MPAEIQIASTAADLASQVRAIAVKDAAASAGEYPAWGSPSTTKPFAFDGDVIDAHQCATKRRSTAVPQTIH